MPKWLKKYNYSDEKKKHTLNHALIIMVSEQIEKCIYEQRTFIRNVEE